MHESRAVQIRNLELQLSAVYLVAGMVDSEVEGRDACLEVLRGITKKIKTQLAYLEN